MTTLIATSVVRGSHQGESHGGVYLIDFESKKVAKPIDWNTSDIDWQGRGWDRGLRGIAFDGERVFIVASDELFVYSPDFELLASYRNPFLKHCHEIFVYQRRLYITSTGFDSILGFDLDKNVFCWGLALMHDGVSYRGEPFDPNGLKGPLPSNTLHINNIFCTEQGMFISGLKTGNLLCFTGREVKPYVSLPAGTHNARPYKEGVLFNDTQANVVRYVTREDQKYFKVPTYAIEELTHVEMDDSRVARQGFGRGLCEVSDGLLAAGSSPSTISLHDLNTLKTVESVTLTHDIRNAVHGLEVWPF